MSFYANPQNDLPAPWLPKRIIFYAQGLKIYGQIPYILQRRLRAEFYSNDVALGGILGGMRMIVPTAEQNYTLVRYRRADGQPHGEKALEQLLDWLYADKGFEMAIAKDFRKQIDLPNFMNMPPETWTPAMPEARPDIRQLLLSAPGEEPPCLPS